MLVVGAAALLFIGRDQWFVYDDWAILHETVAWTANHQGHWNLAATTLFQALRATVGFHSYLPYLALAVIAHLAVAHLLWRVMRRAGVTEAIAAALTGVVIVLGSAAENLLWAFQVGFMGAIALGLAVLLLVDRPVLGPPRAIAAGALAVFSLTFSGTALGFLAAAAILGWIRRGWWRSALLLAPAGAVYLIWQLLYGGSPASLAPHGLGYLTNVPLFFLGMFGAGYGLFTGILFVGPVLAALLAIWVVRRRRQWTGPRAIAFAALLASAVFALLTALTRSGGELSAAGSQRYVYLVVVAAMPAFALALDEVRMRRPAWNVVVALVIAAVALVNAGLLVVRAGEQATLEQAVQREVSAAASRVAEPISDLAQPVLVGAPDITMHDLRIAVRDGLLSPVPFDADDLAAVDASLKLSGR
jgi:hypothetical protein